MAQHGVPGRGERPDDADHHRDARTGPRRSSGAVDRRVVGALARTSRGYLRVAGGYARTAGGLVSRAAGALAAHGVRGWGALTRVVPPRRALVALAVVVVTLAGVAVGMALGARTVTDVGPFEAELRIAPSRTGTTSVAVPPLGSLHFDTHDGPTHLEIRLGALDQVRIQDLINDPNGITEAGRNAAEDVIDGIIRVGFAGLGSAVLGAMALAALAFRNVRRVAWAGGLALVLVGSLLGVGAATVRYSAVEEPRYEGLLANAPALVGDVQRIADEWERYAQQLQQMVVNASLLYTTVSTLPVFEPDETMTRVLHVSDLHLNPNAWSVMATVVKQYDVDLIIDTGDIVDWGTGQESAYVEGIGRMGVPYVYVRGNHDSAVATQAAVAEQPNAVVLDNEVVTIKGLTIAGIGDPRFTPDQRTAPFTGGEPGAQLVVEAGARLAETVTRQLEPVHIAAVHDPRAAAPLDGLVDYVLAGHTHDRTVGPVTPPPEDGSPPAERSSLLMVQGSTGGAGLRGLQGEHPEPLAMSVLYFDPTGRLVAYDDIAVGGHGLSEVTLQRHVLPRPNDAPADSSEADTTPPPTSTPAPSAATPRSPTPSGRRRGSPPSTRTG
ncbi:MAG: metallophosphoesterase [Micromonosporaceae bacterium]|jgi:predicted phosphodiesterase